MRVFIYSLQTAFKNLWRETWINFLTVLSVSVGLLILGAFLLITLNMDSVLNRWSKDFGLVVYLNDGLSSEEEKTLKKIFLQDSDILEAKFISKKQALKELREILGTKSSTLKELKENPLPSSFVLKLKRDALTPSSVEQKAARIELMTGVEDVQYGEKWLSSLNTISGVMKAAAVLLGSATFVAIAFVTYSTIKILFYRRIAEIETLKLLGATRNFIRLPFLLEGLFIGVFGGVISSLALFGMYSFTIFKLIEFMPSIKTIIISLPLKSYIAVPFAGALMSFIGSFFAVGKIRY